MRTRCAVSALMVAVLLSTAAGRLEAMEVAPAAGIAGDPLRSAGRVDAVTVYRGQAQVTRVVDVGREPGLVEVVVTDLPSRVIPGSLFAEGDGLEVRSVLYRESASGEDVRAGVRELDEKIKAVQHQITDAQRQLRVLTEHTAYLGKLENFVAPSATAELTRGVLNAETLSKLSTYLLEQRKSVAQQELTLNTQVEGYNDQLALLQRKQQELSNGAAKTVREAVVLVEAKAAKASLHLLYLVDQAGWTPSYNARQGPENGAPAGKITLEYNASIRQLSGEDWPNVRMRLSTATPSLVALSPSLDSLTLTLASIQAVPAQADYAKSKMELKKQARGFDSLRNLSGAGGPAASRADKELNSVASQLQVLDLLARDSDVRTVADEEREEVAVTYDLSSRTTLASRADQQLVQIASLPMSMTAAKVATPLLTPYVFDEAEVRNDTTTVLLAGEVLSFARGQFVGRGEIPTVAPGQSFTAGFGIDPSLKSTRELLDRKESISGGNKVIEFSYRLRVENYANAAAAVRLLDRLPMSKDGQVKVTLQSPGQGLSGDPEYVAGDAKKGILRWDITVPAAAAGSKAFTLDYTFRVEFDRQMTLSGMAAAQ